MAVIKSSIKAIITKLPQPDDQYRRLMFVADLCARQWPGEVAVLGAGRGGATVKLAAAARRWGRRVIAVETWEPEDRAAFEAVTLPYRDMVETMPYASTDTRVMEQLARRKLCFAWVDGLRDYATVLADAITVANAPVIAVHGGTSSSAIKTAEAVLNREVIKDGVEMERYLVLKGG